MVHLHAMDEISRREYAEEYAEKVGADIDAEVLDRIAFEATDAYSVKDMVAEHNKQE